MSVEVCILDYGSGNVRSVYNLLKQLCSNVKISNDPQDIESATHFILPGVGAFGPSMEKIKAKIPLDIVEEMVLEKKKPFLGICVGMQVLADKGYEFGEFDGLGWIQGNVTKVQVKERTLPHIGWNNISIKKEDPILQDITDNMDFYYVHSYVFKDFSEEILLATSEYDDEITAMIKKDNVYGVQFHPEKSQSTGKLLISNFLKLS